MGIKFTKPGSRTPDESRPNLDGKFVNYAQTQRAGGGSNFLGVQETEIYTYTSNNTFPSNLIPSNTTAIKMIADGAGSGGYVEADFYPDSGLDFNSPFTVNFAGGGPGAPGGSNYAGIFQGPISQGNAVLIGAGGGGSPSGRGGYPSGSQGGTGFGSGGPGPAQGGFGGTQSSGGSGGAGAPSYGPGSPGGALQGGSGGTGDARGIGGGGGGGYFGGGGGGNGYGGDNNNPGGGGGGGSSYISPLGQNSSFGNTRFPGGRVRFEVTTLQ